MKDNKKKMSNESILLGAIKQTSLEEYVLILPNKRDGWEQTASGASTPTLSVEINYFLNEFCFSHRHLLEKKYFIVPFSISGASGQLTLCLQRENRNSLEIKTHFAHRKADICATQTSLWVSALLSHLFPFFMSYIPQPPFSVTPLWFGRGSQLMFVSMLQHTYLGTMWLLYICFLLKTE